MRLGLVRYLNARPLDYGFRLRAESENELRLQEDTPARLYADLEAGRLDAALISSVECLRNRHRFGFCQSVGVCAHHQVDSIVYLQRRVNDRGDESESTPTGRLYVDSGSRSSVALLQILFQRSFPDIRIQLHVCPPEKIPRQLQPGDGGLLIGDSALEFTRSTSARDYQITDLATWWHKLENLPFVFALWAYPLNKPIADEFFEQSLAVGQSNMDHIVADAGALLSLTEARRYLTATLHYKLTEEDRRSLVRFEELLTRYHLSGDADSQSGARSTQY